VIPPTGSRSGAIALSLSSQVFFDGLFLTFYDYRVGTELIIRLKWGQTEYKGKLESIDSYMNVLLRDTEEFIDGKNTGSLGLVLIRCVSGPHCAIIPSAPYAAVVGA